MKVKSRFLVSALKYTARFWDAVKTDAAISPKIAPLYTLWHCQFCLKILETFRAYPWHALKNLKISRFPVSKFARNSSSGKRVLWISRLRWRRTLFQDLSEHLLTHTLRQPYSNIVRLSRKLSSISRWTQADSQGSLAERRYFQAIWGLEINAPSLKKKTLKYLLLACFQTPLENQDGCEFSLSCFLFLPIRKSRKKEVERSILKKNRLTLSLSLRNGWIKRKADTDSGFFPFRECLFRLLYAEEERHKSGKWLLKKVWSKKSFLPSAIIDRRAWLNFRKSHQPRFLAKDAQLDKLNFTVQSLWTPS